MNRKQIEEWLGAIAEYDDIEFLTELGNMALNSIPKAFDPEDETTWPDAVDDYLVYLGGHPVSDQRMDWVFKDVATWDSDKWILAPNDKDITARVLKYMPIPEVGESK